MKLDIRRFVGFGIFIGIACGYFFPAIRHLKPFIPYILGSMLFFSYVKLRFEITRFFRKEIAYLPALIWIILPVLVFFLSRKIGFALDIRLGLFL